MKKAYQKFFEIIKESKNLLLVTHRLSDIDAIASVLLTKELIETNFKGKSIEIKVEFPSYRGVDRMFDSFPETFDEESVDYVNSIEEIDFNKYDTIIMHDGESLSRAFTGNSFDKIDAQKFIVIDHHINAAEKCSLSINEHCSSTAEQIYTIFIENSEIKISEKANVLTQIGILADTQVFIYPVTSSKTLRIYEELNVTVQISRELIVKAMYGTTRNGQEIYKNLLNNMKFNGDCAYSFIDEDLIDDEKYDQNDITYSLYSFADRYLYYIEGIIWGFTIHKRRGDFEEIKYSISFRSIPGTVDVQKLSLKFNGGGHVNGSGASYSGGNYEEIIGKILAEAEILYKK
jgi:nanoRNase/pAp phosphatase (c-di-AMP/oligoRNAs hydrolase)